VAQRSTAAIKGVRFWVAQRFSAAIIGYFSLAASAAEGPPTPAPARRHYPEAQIRVNVKNAKKTKGAAKSRTQKVLLRAESRELRAES
jgi:hypothetical protein